MVTGASEIMFNLCYLDLYYLTYDLAKFIPRKCKFWVVHLSRLFFVEDISLVGAEVKEKPFKYPL